MYASITAHKEDCVKTVKLWKAEEHLDIVDLTRAYLNNRLNWTSVEVIFEKGYSSLQ